jgi:hypothetical protein
MRTKSVRGFQSGDMVRAEVPTGKKAGIHVGRVAVRATGSFNVGAVQGINWKHCRIIHRADGYGYAVSASPVRDFVPTAFLPALKGGVSSGRL